MSSVFGNIFVKGQLEQAAQATLELWMPAHLVEVARQLDRPAGPPALPRTYKTVNEFEPEMGDQLPAVLMISTGTDRQPERDGDGTYKAWFSLALGVIANGQDRAESNDLAGIYAAAVRSIFTQRPSLGGFAEGTEFVGESYVDAPANYLPVGCVARLAFSVLVPGVVTALAGPRTPEVDPAPWPEVETVQTTVERRSLA